MLDKKKFDEIFERAVKESKLFDDEIYRDGVLVRAGEWTAFMSHEGYVKLNEEVIKGLKSGL